jgi:Maintenance of mitochondrial morphology protein 1
MLYEDIQQLEVRYVISLDYHDVDLYSGGEHIPEGELWIKRNSIRLTRRDLGAGKKGTSPPYFLFSESQSEKEDFYFALLKNQETRLDRETPEVQKFDVKDMVTLVQKLHSSEEHLQTRWLNAMMGRWFLAMYKTPQLEDLIRNKLTKKITRVKKPNFITKLALQKIDLGDGAPFITNPRLKDLTVGGDCTVEADVKYTGHFRIEVAATARIDLGTRFKARDIDLVLAVTVNKVEGHALVRFKPPPSNRIWFTFERMPTLEMTVKPIVSTRQITLTVVLKAIESRIREVLAESIVLPFWDDVPFADTTEEAYRGGIWKKAPAPPKSTEIKNEDPEDEAETGPASGTQTPAEITKISDERVFSTPVLSTTKDLLKPRSGKQSVASMSEALGNGAASTGIERNSPLEVPRSLRSSSFATTAAALVTASHADAKRDSNGTMQNSDVAAMLKDLTSSSITASPSESPIGSPQNEPTLASAMKERNSSNASLTSAESPAKRSSNHSKQPSTSSSILHQPSQDSVPATPTTDSFDSERDLQAEGPKRAKTFASTARSLTGGDRKQAIAQISAAAGAAQQWGWGVLNKRRQQREAAPNGSPELRPDVPMGRGHPLPPPGMPLPPPARSSTRVSLGGVVPKRKPLPPPLLPKRNQVDAPVETENPDPSPRPPLPERRQRKSLQNSDAPVEEVFVVEAPTESAPTSPKAEEHHDEFFGHGEDDATPSIPKASHEDGDMYEAEAARRESAGIGPNAWLAHVENGGG